MELFYTKMLCHFWVKRIFGTFTDTYRFDKNIKVYFISKTVIYLLVNLTKICKHFGKRLDVWLKTDSTKRFLEACKVITPNGGSLEVKLEEYIS